MKAWRPWLTMVIKQRKIEREIAATEMSRVVRGFLGRVRAQRVRVHKASVVIQCLGRQFNARRKVQRQRVYRAAVRMICFFSKLLKIKRAKQEVQRRRRNHAATRIQVSNTYLLGDNIFVYHKPSHAPFLHTFFHIPSSVDTETVSWGRRPCPFCRLQSRRNGTTREGTCPTRASATGRNGTSSTVRGAAAAETGGAGEGFGGRQGQERSCVGGQKRKRARGTTAEKTRERRGSRSGQGGGMG